MSDWSAWWSGARSLFVPQWIRSDQYVGHNQGVGLSGDKTSLKVEGFNHHFSPPMYPPHLVFFASMYHRFGVYIYFHHRSHLFRLYHSYLSYTYTEPSHFSNLMIFSPFESILENEPRNQQYVAAVSHQRCLVCCIAFHLSWPNGTARLSPDPIPTVRQMQPRLMRCVFLNVGR